MKTTAIDLRQYFHPVFGTSPWRVKLGVGSFLTFEFGPRIRANHHVHGKWHLWIYLSNWELFHRDRPLVDSDTERKVMETAIRRLEGTSLAAVKFQNRNRETTFVFDDFHLVVSPADYLENPDDRDYFWMFFMPDDRVLAVGPSGVHLEKGNGRYSNKKQQEEIHPADLQRQVRFKD
jgi:hypothetical protein